MYSSKNRKNATHDFESQLKVLYEKSNNEDNYFFFTKKTNILPRKSA